MRFKHVAVPQDIRPAGVAVFFPPVGRDETTLFIFDIAQIKTGWDQVAQHHEIAGGIHLGNAPLNVAFCLGRFGKRLRLKEDRRQIILTSEHHDQTIPDDRQTDDDAHAVEHLIEDANHGKHGSHAD